MVLWKSILIKAKKNFIKSIILFVGGVVVFTQRHSIDSLDKKSFYSTAFVLWVLIDKSGRAEFI